MISVLALVLVLVLVRISLGVTEIMFTNHCFTNRSRTVSFTIVETHIPSLCILLLSPSFTNMCSRTVHEQSFTNTVFKPSKHC